VLLDYPSLLVSPSIIMSLAPVNRPRNCYGLVLPRCEETALVKRSANPERFPGYGSWGSPAKMGVEGESLTEKDQLFILTQAGTYLTYTRGLGAPEAGFVTGARSPCANPLIVPCSYMRH
jgi:hypothetical protein